MTPQFIENIINDRCHDADIIVLKGFSPYIINKLGEKFNLLDSYVIENGKIHLENVNEQRLMLSFMGCQTTSEKAICTCESFIKLCTHITGLSILSKQIYVLENNMLELYPNPTDTSIPDFDSEDFQDTESGNAIYSIFYSFCVHENKMQKVQYIDNFSSDNSCIKTVRIAEPLHYDIAGFERGAHGTRTISTKDGSLDRLMEELYETMTLKENTFAVEKEESAEEMVCAFVQAAHLMGIDIKMTLIARDIDVMPRKELSDCMKEIWGYDSFRNLEMYKDLCAGKDVVEVSQGSIVEVVVRQAEYAYRQQTEKVSNVLLTSPTGAGKSLLFQLAAIYLAKEYNLLTIVVSPLVALMNDQVDGLAGYNGVAALNSNKTAADKERIRNGVKDGTVNLLYLSPELLLSYSITSFVGDRTLGLLVVDEAHTVTTWGRDFRVDYWFLGDYLRKARRVLSYNFPIFALTATAVWDPTGRNDMVFDTIRSLNMDPCIKYIGVVRRTNIKFEIGNSNISKNYEEKRKQLTISRIREAINGNRKTIVYFPFRRTVDSIVLSDDVADIKDKIARYHASLPAEEKRANAEDFRTGKRPIMCATKAFGMGIDVPDIQEVYHHAPTGCLSDYVQEIGRLARDPAITGIAKIDFSENDFRYVRKLHGLSAIKPYQISMVLKKLMSIYRINGEKRNMLISASDFSYIFPLSTPDGIDQNLKSCLLLISNDLLNKLRFHAIIVRPKSIFSKCYIETVSSSEAKTFYRIYHKYVRHITDTVFMLDADKMWNEKYSNMSFPNFKHNLASGKIFKNFNVLMRDKITLMLHDNTRNTEDAICEFFHYAHVFLNEMSTSRHRINFSDMKKRLPKHYDNIRREQFWETFRILYATNSGLGGDVAAYCSVFTSNEYKTGLRESFQLMQSGYDNVANLYMSAYKQHIHGKELCEYCDPNDNIVKLCEFLNSLGIADYQRIGGDQPSIFVRVNNPHYLYMLTRGAKYENDILNNIYERFRFSERIFTYFFTTEMSDKQRWDFIEAYFLGEKEERLLNFANKE